MNNNAELMTVSGLAEELRELQQETFEIREVDLDQHYASTGCTSTTSQSCGSSSCCSTSGCS